MKGKHCPKIFEENQNKSSILLLTFCSEKNILYLLDEQMSNKGRPKMGSIQIEAETEEEAIGKAESMVSSRVNVNWEDCWNAVDACEVTKALY